MSSTKLDNPFYQNYLFSEEDIKRATIRSWHYPTLIFKPMYCQLTPDGYLARFKIDNAGRIYLFSMDKE